MKSDKQRVKGETLLEIRGLKIEGNSDGVWHPIVKGVDLTLKRGEVLGLIGESGAGKSTIGLAAMGFEEPLGVIGDFGSSHCSPPALVKSESSPAEPYGST